jgi:hypothetical protein
MLFFFSSVVQGCHRPITNNLNPVNPVNAADVVKGRRYDKPFLKAGGGLAHFPGSFKSLHTPSPQVPKP